MSDCEQWDGVVFQWCLTAEMLLKMRESKKKKVFVAHHNLKRGCSLNVYESFQTSLCRSAGVAPEQQRGSMAQQLLLGCYAKFLTIRYVTTRHSFTMALYVKEQ